MRFHHRWHAALRSLFAMRSCVGRLNPVAKGETGMNETSAEIAGRWDRENYTATSGESFNEIHIRLDFLEKQYYRQYLPTMGSLHPIYWVRFSSWLRNVGDEADQR